MKRQSSLVNPIYFVPLSEALLLLLCSSLLAPSRYCSASTKLEPPRDENLDVFVLEGSPRKDPLSNYYPPYFKDYLPGYPLAVRDQGTGGLTTVEESLFYFPLSTNLMTFTSVFDGSAVGNWELPPPVISPYEMVFIPVMSAPAFYGEGKRLILPSLIIGKYNPYVLYSIGDWENQTASTMMGSQISWKTPAVTPPYLSKERLAVVVGNQANADLNGAAMEWLNLETGQTKVYPLEAGESLTDDPRYSLQLGRFTNKLGKLQVGLPLSEHYVVMDSEGHRLDVEKIRLPERVIGVDLNHDGLHELVYSIAGAGKIGVAGVDDSQPVKEYPIYLESEGPSSWKVTSLAAFSWQGETFVFATAATDFFKKTRLVLIEADKNGQLSFRFLSSGEDNQLPVGYGLAGLVVNNQILLVSNGYRASPGNQVFMAVLIYSLEAETISVKKTYQFGGWEDGIVSIGYPLVKRLSSNRVGIYAELNIYPGTKTWLIGLQARVPRTSGKFLSSLDGDLYSWTSAVGGNSFYTNTLPLY